ncbi:FliH/SctL family protein [Sphingosinithalassobacter sp. LHW66-3]|uniref:FliH/SctL family protein n=1 Tax=Sphingosinithalassobacter sp. LHW66-3 TaxID=3424718 RepID=UPI003D6C6ED2
MSSFAPGLVMRHAAAGDLLKKAFEGAAGFTAVDPAASAACDFAPQAEGPRHFKPADPSRNPTEGWDPFDAELPPAQPQPQPSRSFSDPVAAAHAAGVAEGRAAALAEIEAARAREGALLDQVSTALARGAHFDRERMAGQLRQTVLHLVHRLIGETGIASDLLDRRVAAAVDLLADSAESALLRLHPEDVPLLEGKLPARIFAVGDAHVSRGGFVIESASTIIEDGPDLWLEQLAEAIDKVPIPPPC